MSRVAMRHHPDDSPLGATHSPSRPNALVRRHAKESGQASIGTTMRYSRLSQYGLSNRPVR
jgi:hypothetical protein